MKPLSQNLFLLLLLGTANLLFSQTTINGKVSDKKNPLVAVSITLKDTYDGATSDSSGRYSFKTTEKGEFLLTATSVGYRPFEQKITLGGQSTLNIDIVMKEEVTELAAVVISAGMFEASDRKRAAAVLTPIDIVTTASANGDLTGALKTLPGAQQVGESEGLFVRGGTAAETKIFIDGTLVNDFFQSSAPNIAGLFEASDRKRAAAVLTPIDIVTTASANGDLTGALKTLPGAQQVGESEGLFVRGGTAAETKIFIDGTLVNDFFQSSAPNIAG